MAQAVQEKLEESLGEDQGEDLEASAGSSPQSKVENSFIRLRCFLSCGEVSFHS